jgi:uncharacterized protein (TIGR03435 family)
LKIARQVLLAVAAFVVSAPGADTPAFDVASVRASNSPSDQSKISGATPGRFVASNTPLRFIVLNAYQLLDHQLIGMPDWTSTIGFDITATYPPGGAPTETEVRLMVRNLLRERFGFTAHREQRELPAYSLILARKDRRLGPQLRRSDAECEGPQADAGGPSPVTPSGKRPACGMVATRRFLTGGTRSMGQLAAALQSMVGRPVVDRTGITGTFDIDLQWVPSEVDVAPGGNPPSNDGPSIFTALQEQLGLKLEPRRDRFNVLGG